MIQQIRKHDDPILSTVCAPVDPLEHLAWLDDLRETCIANNGAGIAAPQIGVAKCAIYIAYGREHGLLMVNPVLSDFSEATETQSEGCLSYPGVWTPVVRHVSVRAEWQVIAGGVVDDTFSRTFTGYQARVLQHEVDHLNGMCRVGDAWREQTVEETAGVPQRRRAMPCSAMVSLAMLAAAGASMRR